MRYGNVFMIGWGLLSEFLSRYSILSASVLSYKSTVFQLLFQLAIYITRLLVPGLTSLIHFNIHVHFAALVPDIFPAYSQAGKGSQTCYAYQEVKDIAQTLRVRS